MGRHWLLDVGTVIRKTKLEDRHRRTADVQLAGMPLVNDTSQERPTSATAAAGAAEALKSCLILIQPLAGELAKRSRTGQ